MDCHENTKAKVTGPRKYLTRTSNSTNQWNQYLRELEAHGVHERPEGRGKTSTKKNEPKIYFQERKPVVVPSVYPVTCNLYNRRLAEFVKYEGGNALLLKRIQQVYKRKPHTLDQVQNKAAKYFVNKNGDALARQAIKTVYENLRLYERIQAAKPLITTRQAHSKSYARHQALIRNISSFPLSYEPKSCFPSKLLLNQRTVDSPADCVYLDIEVQDKIAGRIVIELFADVTPIAAENFRSLCTADTKNTYKCIEFDKVIPGILWRANTAGVKSKIGPPFPAENFKMKHDEEGLISMPTFEGRGLRSEFLITLRPLQCLDGENVVVGKIIHGLEFITEATYKCKPIKGCNGTPVVPIIVTNCGNVTDMDETTSTTPMLFREVLEQARAEAEVENIASTREIHEEP